MFAEEGKDLCKQYVFAKVASDRERQGGICTSELYVRTDESSEDGEWDVEWE